MRERHFSNGSRGPGMFFPHHNQNRFMIYVVRPNNFGVATNGVF